MTFNAYQLLESRRECEKVSCKLFDNLKERPELKGKVIFPEGDHSDSACFRLKFVPPERGTEHPIGGVSICIPEDANGYLNDNPTIGELMLLVSVPKGADFFSTSRLAGIYDPFGYHEQCDMKRFYPSEVDGLVEEVLEEVLRLSNCLSLPLSALPPVQYHDESYESDGWYNDQPDDSSDLSDSSNDELMFELNDSFQDPS